MSNVIIIRAESDIREQAERRRSCKSKQQIIGSEVANLNFQKLSLMGNMRHGKVTLLGKIQLGNRLDKSANTHKVLVSKRAFGTFDIREGTDGLLFTEEGYLAAKETLKAELWSKFRDSQCLLSKIP